MYKDNFLALHKSNIYRHIHYIAFAAKMAAMVDDLLSPLITFNKGLAKLGFCSEKLHIFWDAPVI